MPSSWQSLGELHQIPKNIPNKIPKLLESWDFPFLFWCKSPVNLIKLLLLHLPPLTSFDFSEPSFGCRFSDSENAALKSSMPSISAHRGVLDHTSNKRTFDINIELPRDFNEHLRSLKMLQNKSTTSWLSYSFFHHRTKHSSSSSKWKAPTILISLLIDCYGRKKITTYIFIFANLNAFLLKLCDFWLLPFHFTSHWGTAKSISCLVRRIPIRGPAWLCLGGNGVSRPQFPKWSFTAVPFFWALQIRLPRSFFTWSSPRRKKSMKFSEKKISYQKISRIQWNLGIFGQIQPKSS